LAAVVIAMSGASIFTITQHNASTQMSDATATNNMTHTMIEPRDMTIIMRGENVTSSINLMNIISNAIESQIKVSLSVMPQQQ
jgi:hypothetical protein